jgi:uncharacterized protein DUF4403
MQGCARAWAASVLLAVVLSGCANHFEVPVPVVSEPPPLPPQPVATVAIPVHIAMSAVASGLSSVFPPTDSLDRAQCLTLGGLVCHQYLYRRDTLDVSMQGDRITIFTRLRYRGRVALPGVGGIASCGFGPDSMKRAEMRMTTALFWTTAWRIASKGTSLTPRLLDPCQITVLNVDATPLMRKLIEGQLERLRKQVDSVVPAVADLRPSAESLWTVMSQPIALDSASTVWLVMAPEAAQLTALTGGGAVATTAILLTARPRVVVGTQPAVTQKPLPSLTLTQPASGLHVPVQIELPFAELSDRATAMMAALPPENGVKVNDVRIWGSGDTAVVKVGVAGKVTGSLYMLGRVAYDSTERAVLIKDLQYTLASNSAMSRFKASIGSGRIKHGIDEVTGHGHLRIGEQLDSLGARLTQELNRTLAPGVSLTGAIRSISIDRLYTTQTAFVLRVVLDGDATIEVR